MNNKRRNMLRPKGGNKMDIKAEIITERLAREDNKNEEPKD